MTVSAVTPYKEILGQNKLSICILCIEIDRITNELCFTLNTYREDIYLVERGVDSGSLCKAGGRQ